MTAPKSWNRDRDPWWLLVDPLLMLTSVAIGAMGVILVYSATRGSATTLIPLDRSFMERQALFLVAGIGVGVVAAFVDVKRLRSLAPLGYAGLLLALVMVLVVGVEVNGARAWFQLAGFQFQRCRSRALRSLAQTRFSRSLKGLGLADLAALIGRDGRLTPRAPSVPAVTRAFAAAIVRSAMKALAVTTTVWGEEVDKLQDLSNNHREHVIYWRQDLGRSLDYLATRPDLFDPEGFSYFGYSWGGRMGVIMLAVEPRFKAGVLYVAGLSLRPTQPVVEPLNFAPRVRVPVLMLNGQNDHIYPLETQSLPLFKLLGSDVKDQIISPGGHFVPQDELIRESLGWLDTHVGVAR